MPAEESRVSEVERQLTPDEMAILRRLAVGDGEDESTPSDLLLAWFAGYIAAELYEDGYRKEPKYFTPDQRRETVQDFGFVAVDQALSIRNYVAASEWPDEVTPPSIIYARLERWLEDAETQNITVAGMSVKEYLSQGFKPEEHDA